MRTLMAGYVLLLLIAVTGCARGHEMKGNGLVQSQVDALVTKLANGGIGKVEILQIPASILTRTSITPQMLETQFHYKLTIRDVRSEVYEKKLIQVTKSIVAAPETEMPDLRWGVIFYGVDNDERAGAFYFDKTGRRGVVGDIPVIFDGSFFKWLNSTFSGCFQ